MSKWLFVVNNFNVGGPQKSLLSLLHYFPYDEKVDLVILNGENTLVEYLPENVNVIKEDDIFRVLMLNRKGILNNLITEVVGNPKLVFKAFWFLTSNIRNDNMTSRKQLFWRDNKHQINSGIKKEYDVAIGVSGGHSIMYIADFIQARSKVGWIRTEYSNLQRDKEIDSLYFEQMDLILTVSKMCKNNLVAHFPTIKNKVVNFNNPLPFLMYDKIKTNKIRTNTYENINTFTTICRLDHGKGLEIVIEVAKKLKEKGYNFIWEIYGEGKLKRSLQSQIENNSLEKHVLLKGFIFNTGEILRSTDIFIHTSKFEGKSNAVEEAKFYAIPIVSTKYPTVKEQLIDDYNSVLTEISIDGVYNGITKLLEDKQLQKRLIMNLKSDKEHKRDVYKEFKNIIERV